MNSSSVYDNDEFKRIVGLSLGQGSLMMRKDRRGIAITKGSKRHRITFRDEVPEEVAKLNKQEATVVPKNMSNTDKIKPITLPDDMGNSDHKLQKRMFSEDNRPRTLGK